MRTGRGLAAAIVFAGACGAHGSTAPTAVDAHGAIRSLSVGGLPSSLLFDTPPWVEANGTYVLTATATFADGSSAPLDPAQAVWSSSDSSVARFVANLLVAVRPGTVTIRVATASRAVAALRDVSVYTPGISVREERSGESVCGQPQTCPYPFPAPWCPQPLWLFPVHTTGTIELQHIENPAWSPDQYVVQLSPKGEQIDSWGLTPTDRAAENGDARTATVPGGFMYALVAHGELGPCGHVAAVWTHPS